LTAYHAGSESDRVFWRRTIEDSEQTEADLDHALHLMAQTGAIEATIRRAVGFSLKAKSALTVFPDSLERRCLEGVADYTVRRAR
jgi:octaprenyl-diphosphate synthase